MLHGVAKEDKGGMIDDGDGQDLLLFSWCQILWGENVSIFFEWCDWFVWHSIRSDDRWTDKRQPSLLTGAPKAKGLMQGAISIYLHMMMCVHTWC